MSCGGGGGGTDSSASLELFLLRRRKRRRKAGGGKGGGEEEAFSIIRARAYALCKITISLTFDNLDKGNALLEAAPAPPVPARFL
jgi:hypothetical protein